MTFRIDVPSDVQRRFEQMGLILRQGWLMSLGLVGTTADFAKQTFTNLVARGQKVRGAGESSAGSQAKQVSGVPEPPGQALGEKVEEIWNRALVQFNLPTRREIDELTRRIESLSARLS